MNYKVTFTLPFCCDGSRLPHKQKICKYINAHGCLRSQHKFTGIDDYNFGMTLYTVCSVRQPHPLYTTNQSFKFQYRPVYISPSYVVTALNNVLLKPSSVSTLAHFHRKNSSGFPCLPTGLIKTANKFLNKEFHNLREPSFQSLSESPPRRAVVLRIDHAKLLAYHLAIKQIG